MASLLMITAANNGFIATFPLTTRILAKPSVPYNSTAISCSRPANYIPNRVPDPKYVRVFDTTLRDGEQSPGASMTGQEKLDIARQLAKLGVDIIEAGFPAASNEDLEAVRMIAKEVGNEMDEEDGHVPVICGLARCDKEDIDALWEAVRHARRPRILTFIATSEIHMRYKLNMSREEVVEKARSMVRYARSLGCDDVMFGAEDAGRSDREFLYQIFGEVIKAGATTIGIGDTTGYMTPDEFGQLIADIIANTSGIENAIISTHCHNDLGLATANTLAGACAGARQVDVTINGIGERAGNASLEEVVMALKCRGHMFGGLHTGINTEHIIMASKMVEEISGLHVQPHKAIVGANVFAHESGIHHDVMVKHENTYEIMSPEDIGLHWSNKSVVVLAELRERYALRSRLSELGHDIDNEDLDCLFWCFKTITGKKKNVTDDDLKALVSDVVLQQQVVWKLGDVQVTCGTIGLPVAIVRLIDANGEEHIECANGTGPVDSAYKAVDHIVKGGEDLKDPNFREVHGILLEYSLNAVTEGIDAIATTRVLIRGEYHHISTHSSGATFHHTFSGAAHGMDLVVSSVQAYLNALNKMLAFNNNMKQHNIENSRVLA